MAKQLLTQEDDDLLAELGVAVEASPNATHTPKEERIIAGFEEIQQFFSAHDRAPQHGEDRDIFERLYAVRLDRLRSLEECRNLIAPLDHQELLGEGIVSVDASEEIDDQALLAELEADETYSSLTSLRHVRTTAEKQDALQRNLTRNSPDEIASREPCKQFDHFERLFIQAENQLKSGVRQSVLFSKNSGIEKGSFYILGGQLLYVAELGGSLNTTSKKEDERLRVIYANGMESNLLFKSLQRALYKDKASRRLTDPVPASLFKIDLNNEWQEEDISSGTIYVLRSHSNHPFVVEHRNLIHKIGVTGGKVEKRIASAAHDPTYLLADVEVVASYKLSGINRIKLENLFHRVFAAAQLDLIIQDRFGNPVKPREWFLVPLHIIDEVVKKVVDGSIIQMIYAPEQARLIFPA